MIIPISYSAIVNNSIVGDTMSASFTKCNTNFYSLYEAISTQSLIPGGTLSTSSFAITGSLTLVNIVNSASVILTATSSNTLNINPIIASSSYAINANYALTASLCGMMPYSSSIVNYSPPIQTGSFYCYNSASVNLLYIYTGLSWRSCSLS